MPAFQSKFNMLFDNLFTSGRPVDTGWGDHVESGHVWRSPRVPRRVKHRDVDKEYLETREQPLVVYDKHVSRIMQWIKPI